MSTTSYESGGYDCHVINEDHDLSCPICLMILKEPHLMSCCGVKTCSLCMTTIKEGTKPECPWCREKNFTTMLDKSTMRQVLSLEVYCNNKNEAGCDWIGEIRFLEDHLKSCFVYTQCKYECGYKCHVKKSDELIQHENNECEKRPEIILTKEVSLLKEKITSLEEECDEKKSEIKEYEKLVERERNEHEKEIEQLRREMEEVLSKFEDKEQELKKCKKIIERGKSHYLQNFEKEKDAFRKEIGKLQIIIKERENELREIKESFKTLPRKYNKEESDDEDKKQLDLKQKQKKVNEEEEEEEKEKEEEEDLDGSNNICTKCSTNKTFSGLTNCTSCADCPSCHQPLKNDLFIATSEGYYHKNCFYCFNCQKTDNIVHVVAETFGNGLVCQYCLDHYFDTCSSD